MSLDDLKALLHVLREKRDDWRKKKHDRKERLVKDREERTKLKRKRKSLIKVRDRLRREWDHLPRNTPDIEVHKLKAKLTHVTERIETIHDQLQDFGEKIDRLKPKYKYAKARVKFFVKVRLPHVKKKIAAAAEKYDPLGNDLVDYDGKTVGEWLAYRMEVSRAAGWVGYMVSGWRSPEYSESLCYGICGHPACPGTCAGRASHHSQHIYPYGAVDVSDYTNFGALQRSLDSRVPGVVIWNNLPYDRVHFSSTGN